MKKILIIFLELMKDTLIKRGFTLIELLVVIAIIGILSTIVLASLDSARNKAVDGTIKADLDNSRAQAELYYDGKSNNYTNVCTTATGGNPGGILDMKNGAIAAGSAAVSCLDSSSAWAMSAQLKSTTTLYWCVDSTGTSTTKAAGIFTTHC